MDTFRLARLCQEGAILPKTHPVYKPEFRADAVPVVSDKRRPLAEIAGDLGISRERACADEQATKISMKVEAVWSEMAVVAQMSGLSAYSMSR